MDGLIFSVKRYSVYDGPGIRVTFFMKGCPLSCRWCHNPEGISFVPESVELTDRIGGKEFARMEVAGKYYSVNEVLDIIERDNIFIKESGGGVTFSGGEPLSQPVFLHKTLKACKAAGYHTAVDTSGYVQERSLMSIIPFTDLFLYDLKIINHTRHVMHTGVSNTIILNNLKKLIESGKDIMIRIPVIPGINDNPDDMNELRQFICSLKSKNISKISLLPYHKSGSSKYRKFKLPYRMDNISPPSDDRMSYLKDFFAETGIPVKTGG